VWNPAPSSLGKQRSLPSRLHSRLLAVPLPLRPSLPSFPFVQIRVRGIGFIKGHPFPAGASRALSDAVTDAGASSRSVASLSWSKTETFCSARSATRRRTSPPDGVLGFSLPSAAPSGVRGCGRPGSSRGCRIAWKKCSAWKSACGPRNGVMSIAGSCATGPRFSAPTTRGGVAWPASARGEKRCSLSSGLNDRLRPKPGLPLARAWVKQ
jgi:hypothetical protein